MADQSSTYVIMGGGIAGLSLACLLSKNGKDVTLIEKSGYPSHRVCGEYVSNEVLPFMEKELLLPDLAMPEMTHFQLSDTSGKTIKLPLDLGGFGISRYALDYHLYQQAKKFGAHILTREKVTDLSYANDRFEVRTNKRTIKANWLIGAFGKRSTLDKLLNRPFMNKRSPYMGVKYHVKNPGIPKNVVSLHNFHGGYCGVNAVENDIVNVCYLAHRSVMDGHNAIDSMESEVLLKNPELREVFETSEFLWEKPAVINEISFETKAPVDNHILMCGDAAGMITPLCGNGMAIAMHSANILAAVLLQNPSDCTANRSEVEEQYSTAWKEQFARRLGAGRHIQKLFGNGKLSNFSVQLGRYIPSVAHWLMAQTHGVPFTSVNTPTSQPGEPANNPGKNR